METIQQSIQSVLEQIESAKHRGKHLVKIKTFQCEMKEVGNTKVPSKVFVKVGMSRGGSGEKYLLEHGYNVEYKSTTQQITIKRNMDGSFKGAIFRDLNTTNMVITW